MMSLEIKNQKLKENSNPTLSRTESLSGAMMLAISQTNLVSQTKTVLFWSPRWFFLRLKHLGTDMTTLALYAHELAHAQKASERPNWTCSEQEAVTATESSALWGASWDHHPSCQLWRMGLKKSPLKHSQKYPCQGQWEQHPLFSYFCSLPAFLRSRCSTWCFPAITGEPEIWNTEESTSLKNLQINAP